MFRRGGVALWAGLLALLIAPADLAAQTATTTTSTTTTVPVLPTTTTTTVPPGPTTTTTTIAPEDDPGNDEQGVPDDPPPADDPGLEAAAALPTPDPRLRTAIVAGEATAIGDLLEAEEALGAVSLELGEVAARRQQIMRDIRRIRARERDAAAMLARSRDRLAGRAANMYVQGPGELSFILDAKDPSELLHRAALARSVLDTDRDSLARAKVAYETVASNLAGLIWDLGGTDDRARELRDERAVLEVALRQQRAVVEMFRAGSVIGIAGFVFPVGDPHSFVDTFGAPRMTGTEYEHWHQGTDIFAPSGTPLYAVERGLISRVGTDVLGGTKLWVTGVSGTRYYYAHLSGYAPGIVEGSIVEAGDVVGYVGNTGNALTTPPHLHFEIHPAGIGPVNPYPILAIADRFRSTRPSEAEIETEPPTEPPR